MKRLLTSLCLLFSQLLFAQADKLSINEVFPDERVVDFVVKEHKPVILDFFASTCALCFKKMPELKQIQDSFSQNLRILLLGIEDGKIQSVYKQFEKKFDLSFAVYYDSVLPKKIGLRACPTYIWIDTAGRVRAITGIDGLTILNIERFVKNQIFQPTKQFVAYHYNFALPFLLNNNGGPDSSIMLRYTCSKWQPGQPIYFPPSIYNYQDSSRFIAMCASIDRLYHYAYDGYGDWNTTSKLYGSVWPKVIVADEDTFKVRQISDNKYCLAIECKRPFGDVENLQSILKNALLINFGYHAKVETRNMPCWFLRVNKRLLPKIISKDSTSSVQEGQSNILLKNQPVSVLIRFLAVHYHLVAPIIDETAIGRNIDLELQNVFFDLSELQDSLAAKGLLLVRGEKKMSVIVLKKQ